MMWCCGAVVREWIVTIAFKVAVICGLLIGFLAFLPSKSLIEKWAVDQTLISS